MARRKRGVKGHPWYRPQTDGWYITIQGKQAPIRDEYGVHVRGEDNRETAEKQWVRMQARAMVPDRGASTPVRQVFSLFLDKTKSEHPDAYDKYRRCLVGFADSLPDYNLPVSELTVTHIERWFTAHPEWESSTTQATYLAPVLAALNWAADPVRRLIPDNPLAGMRRPRRRSRGKEARFRPEDHENFIAHVPEDFALVLRVLRDTGTRPSNICRVTAANLDFENGGWHLDQHKTAEKTGTALFVPLTEELMEVCRQLAKKYPSGPLFRTKTGEPWDSDKIAMRFTYWRERLREKGVPVPETFYAYAYRHTLLTEALEDGMSEAHVAAIAGHTGTQMLHQHYSHILDSRKTVAESLRKHVRARAHKSTGTGEKQTETGAPAGSPELGREPHSAGQPAYSRMTAGTLPQKPGPGPSAVQTSNGGDDLPPSSGILSTG